jgi:hypothetical protein
MQITTYDYSIGIDIGKNGAIIVQDLITGEITKHIMPLLGNEIDVKSLYDILLPYKDKKCMCGIEDLHAIFGSSAKSTYSFGFIAGATEAIIISLGIPYAKIQAKVWQKEAFRGIKEIRKNSTLNKNGVEVKGKLDTKAMALLASKRLYPKFDSTPSERSKKAHDGIVDALLISDYIINNYN